jgi:hypothetical protein
MSIYHLAELRCYEKNSLGVDVSNRLSYVFVEKLGDHDNREYQNIFTDEIYPVVKRSQIGRQVNYYFEEDSSKVFSNYGEVGLCYVLTNVSVCNLPMKDVKSIVLNSDHYFKDRKNLMEELYSDDLSSTLRRNLYDDYRSYEKMKETLEEKGIRGKVLVR